MQVKKKLLKRKCSKAATACKKAAAGKKASSKCKGKSSRSAFSNKIDEARLNQMIRERAYYIWEEKNRPLGRDAEIWSLAEKDISNQTGRR